MAGNPPLHQVIADTTAAEALLSLPLTTTPTLHAARGPRVALLQPKSVLVATLMHARCCLEELLICL